MKIYSKPSITALFIAIILLALPGEMMAQSAQINHNPSQVEVEVGETFEVIIEINPASELVSVVDIHMLFDPVYLEVQSIENLQQGFSGNLIAPEFNNIAGTISMASFELGSSIPTQNFEAVKITFKALMESQATHVTHPMNVFPKTLLAYNGENRLGSVGDLEITILPGALVSDGIQDNDVSNLTLWPNPATEYAYITFTAKRVTQIALELYDLKGKKLAEIYNGNIDAGIENRFEIDVRNLAAGVYISRVVTDQGAIDRKLVVDR